MLFAYCLGVSIPAKYCALALVLICLFVACGADKQTEPSTADELPYSPLDFLVTQEEQIALTQWCEENSAYKDLDCEQEVAKVALQVGFRENRADEKCWVELFADRITGKFALDQDDFESRSQSCVAKGLTRIDN